MIILAAETPKDQEMLDKFQRAYENLRKIVDKKNRKIKELEDQIEEYRKRHPSNVGVKNGKTYAISLEGNEQDPDESHDKADLEEKRKAGAQRGHTGHSRITSKPTGKVNVRLDLHECPECHSPLRRKGSRKRIMEDIPIIKPDILEYRLHRLYCSRCHRTYEPRIPDALPNATLSLRAMLTVAYFRTGMRMSIENTASTMLNIFGIRISEGGIQNILSQLSDYLGKACETLLDTIGNAPSRHMDSTSWSINGNPYNLWTFLTKTEAIFLVSKSNSHEVPMYTLKDHNGTDVHDRHSAFETLAKATGNDQQYCWSHIICDAKELEDFYGDEGKRIKESLQTVYDDAKSFEGHGTMYDIEDLHHRLVFLLDSDYESMKCRKFVENLLKRKREWLFNFVINPDVEPTNNRAERALRPSVIYRKISGGSRSERGSEIYTKIYSVYYTSKLKGKNFIRDTQSVIGKSANPG